MADAASASPGGGRTANRCFLSTAKC